MRKSILWPLISVFALFWFFFPHSKTDEGKNVFSTSFYNEVLEKSGRRGEEASREAHERFVVKIREGKIDDETLRQIYFVDLTSSYENFLFQFIDRTAPLEKAFTLLKQNPQFNGLETPPRHEDPFFNGNIPSLQLVTKEGLHLIRMPQPAMDHPFYRKWFSNKALIQPEFRAFLKWQNPNKHLYVNLMKRHGDEKEFSSQIEKLENEESNLAVITLDKNSTFYWQEGFDEEDAALFKERYRKHLKGKDYYWSSHISFDLQPILDQIHQNYFNEKPRLDRNERQSFIELTYLVMIDAALLSWNPNSMNITCKQSMDRGPSLSLLWIWHHEGFDANPTRELAYFLAPPLLFHNRPSHLPRVERLIDASKYLYSKKSLNH